MDGVGVTASSISNVCVLCELVLTGSVAGPFSHVAILLSCVVSSEFKQLVPAHKEHIHSYTMFWLIFGGFAVARAIEKWLSTKLFTE